jgi:3-phenylpropionate/cinnamic acid dioxygenase small subunit
MVSNVRVVSRAENEISVEANFILYRHRRDEDIRTYVGQYRYVLRVTPSGLRIAQRDAILDALELGSMGLVSFIL